MSISIILPSYKEADNLVLLIPKIQSTLDLVNIKYEILIMDTIEPLDNTETICSQLQVRYIKRENGNNYGDAIRTGIKYANGRYIVVMDADGSHDPNDIIRFYDRMQKGEVDLVIGSRYCDGGNSHNGSILKLLSYIVNLVYRVVFHINAKDVSNSFRMYKADQLKSLKLLSDNFDLVEEIIIKLVRDFKPFKIIEIPIFFQKRLYGESKRNLLTFSFSYISSIIRLYKLK